MTVDGGSGHVKEISNQISDKTVELNQRFYWYWGSNGDNSNSTQVTSVCQYVCLFVSMSVVCGWL